MFSTFSQTEMTQISLPSRILKLVKSLPFQTLEVWKRYHFRVELPLLSYCRRYPPGIYACSSRHERNNHSSLKQSACYKIDYFLELNV